jgi:hypothetical protein
VSDSDDYDPRHPELERIRQEIGRLTGEHACQLQRQMPDEIESEPIVVAWSLAFEANTVETERQGQAIRWAVMPMEQTLSASVGLAAFMQNRWG